MTEADRREASVPTRAPDKGPVRVTVLFRGPAQELLGRKSKGHTQ